MKINDLINICIHNLFRHKSRTILTILGVIIGCASVVTMISFGIGMRISQESMLSEMGDLRLINIYSNRDDVKVTEQTVEALERLNNVIAVNPKTSMNNITTTIKTGVNDRYKVDYPTIVGIKKENIDAFDYEIIEGRNMETSKEPDTFEVIAGEYFAYSLYDSLKPEGSNYIDYWSYIYGEDSDKDDMPDPYVDVFNTTFNLILGDEDQNSNDKTLTYKLKIVGIVKEDYSKGYETSSGLMFNIDDIKKMTKEYNQTNNIVSKNSGSYGETYVKVDDIKNVAETETKIKDMGFNTSSLESIREPMEKEVRQKQLMFAGLGIVSLFVAALGIMNTMIMAISERKREIGVMKALGCFIKDIKTMFLMEAGIIGFIGGIIGAIISYLISVLINVISTETEIIDFSTLYQVLFVNTDRVSVVPWWLALSAIIFSVFVGVISGYYPASSAIKVPSLDAIRSE